ncbi:hypothetical protein ACFPMF_00185 [Larkinella bovis]|uniref:Uncharacterized protein n=1 Tax=Larkinella bovis TaxID=683041 RepID=A0ABW0I518_9BACT
MKTYIAALALSGLTILTATAQNDQKIRRDHTISTHNYKHPNKAAKAQKLASQRGETISAPGLDNRAVVNYKQPVPNAAPADGYLVPHKANENLADRNYKMQRPSGLTPVEQPSEVATTPGKELPKENK